MHSQDYLGFISNLVNCIKLGRNTSIDKDQEEEAKVKIDGSGSDEWCRVDSYAEEG